MGYICQLAYIYLVIVRWAEEGLCSGKTYVSALLWNLKLPCATCRVAALASFAGHISKASPHVELTALLQYLANQLRSVQGNDLPVLRELISVMSVRVVPKALEVNAKIPCQQKGWSDVWLC